MLHEVASAADHITDEEAAPFAIALLAAGARTNVRDDILRSTPLGWACRWGRAGVAKALLEHGADPIEADGEPWARPKARAAKMKHPDLVKMLVAHGAREAHVRSEPARAEGSATVVDSGTAAFFMGFAAIAQAVALGMTIAVLPFTMGMRAFRFFRSE